ncbi:MAG TPA: CHAP domain-containing protein [Candidatus Saccharimonadales bacterium]|nr:CHAP domain-containing protein [Candidatus Saccharimonadales bacterium]
MNLRKQKPQLFKKIAAGSVLVLAAFLFTAFSIVPQVRADSYDQQIKQLQNENAAKQNVLNDLKDQAATYQDAIAILQALINALQGQINENVAQQQALQVKIDEAQKELDRQRKILGENIRTMYVEGQISTLEMLATSKNLSDFVDKEEYRTAVKTKIQGTLKRIAELQNQLNGQKTEVEKLLAEQRSQQASLDASRAEQSRMLNYNVAQQNSFNNEIKNNQSRISELRKQQSIENQKLSGGKVIGGKACDSGNGDTYPASAPGPYGRWGCSYPIDNTIDNWGMYNRECVSYTAWKVHESGRYMPYWGGRGNAKNWDDNARAAGIPVSESPRAGDVAVKNAGTYGHVLYVEHVYGDGDILVSDYNQQFDGVYRQYTVSKEKIAANDLQFIHF